MKCSFFGLSNHEQFVVNDATILGEAGRTYTVEFKPAALTKDLPVDDFCHGRAFVQITSVSIDHASKETSRKLGKLRFRVLPAP